MSAPRRRVRLSAAGALAFLAATALVAPSDAMSYAGGASGTPAGQAPAPATQAQSATTATVRSERIIGYSVRKRAIRAYEMGSRKASKTVVIIGAMHGNEKAGSVVISAMMAGRPIKGVHIWAIRRDNPDGYMADHRRNAHGVDLNRNFPTRWKRLYGNYNSGPYPASERETRVLMRFLDRIDPAYVVTMHSPLHGIDVYGAKDKPFARRLARNLRLPIESFDCSGSCHGTLTQWFNRHHQGACVTVEFGPSPSSRYLHVGAPRGLMRAIGGHH